MVAVFKVTSNADSQFQFEFVNTQGEVLLTSPEFTSQSDAEKAIQDVRVGSLMSQLIAKSTTADGEHFFIIKDNSGAPVARSMLFDNEMRFNNALHSVRESACIAGINLDAVMQ
ncbi:DUF1508 domain-containing protein [Pseudomaricurvus sp. HS19]|uniref:DUF1508 domain-containing protein n=1 Tax=Pseudomaricurvus sp. HS19 TaxID=2692626 RepID=UPI00136FC590|nr:DUF1508 domain-containing protein [Pseudomaricurvus sp. HS19]MYM63031.1 DUF1508 domain-containing protein [Pseudomaricurvus sp. HS19]